jgi:hypothetical protein
VPSPPLQTCVLLQRNSILSLSSLSLVYSSPLTFFALLNTLHHFARFICIFKSSLETFLHTLVSCLISFLASIQQQSLLTRGNNNLCYSWTSELQPSRRHRLCDLIGSRQDKITDQCELKRHYCYLSGHLHQTTLQSASPTYKTCTVLGEILLGSLTWLEYVSIRLWACVTISCCYKPQKRNQENLCQLRSVANISCSELGRISLFTFTTYEAGTLLRSLSAFYPRILFHTAFNLPWSGLMPDYRT